MLQRLQAQRQKVQEALEELDQQKGSLEEQLTHIRQQTNQETNLVGLVEYSLHDRLFYSIPILESYVTTEMSDTSLLTMVTSVTDFIAAVGA